MLPAAKGPDDDVSIKKIRKNFEESLIALDGARDWSLSSVWRECCKFHDDNSLLRENMLQTQAVLQELYRDWAETKEKLNVKMRALDPESVLYLDDMKQILDINERLVSTLAKVSTLINTLKKEIRVTEFQSKYYYHINLVQQFMAGMTGILFKHLQSTDKLDAILKDMKQLATIFAAQEQNEN